MPQFADWVKRQVTQSDVHLNISERIFHKDEEGEIFHR